MAIDGRFQRRNAAAELRRRAEAVLGSRPERLQPVGTDPAQLGHELSVHQIELELQNEELQRSLAELSATRDRLFELYELAPVGYITIGGDGVVIEANLRATALLGTERCALVGRRWDVFVCAEHRPRCRQFLFDLRAQDRPLSCELEAERGDGTRVWLRLDGITTAPAVAGAACRIALSDITETRHLQATLARSELRLRAILNNLSEGVLQIDLQGRIVFSNPRLEDLLGYRPGEMIGRSWFEVMDEANAARVRAEMPQNGAGRGGTMLDLCVRHKDGTPIDIRLSGVPLRDETGQLEGFLAVVSDIREHRRTERLLSARLRLWERAAGDDVEGLLRQALDEVEALTDSAAACLYVVDPGRQIGTRQVRSTRTLEEIGAAAGDGARDTLEPAGAWVECLRQGRPVVHNDRGSLPDGTGGLDGHVPVVRELLVPIVREGKAVAVLRAANKPTDYTDEDLKTAEFLAEVAWAAAERILTTKALRESEARYRLLFESSRDAIMTLAPPSWRFTDANAATLRMFRARDEADLASRAFWELLPERQPDGTASSDKAREVLEIAMHEGSHSFEWTQRRLDGETFPAHVLLTRVPSGKEPFLQATIRDLTEVKRLQAQVSQADRLASMGMLAAGVAHELNNPLAYVLYNLESVAEELPGLGRTESPAGPDAGGAPDPRWLDDAVTRLREAVHGARKIKEIVRSLGTFSRVEEARLVPVDLRLTAEHALNMAFNEIKYRAQVVKDLAPVPPVLGTEGRLAQVFLNLLVNAAHSIPEGHVSSNQIRVRTWQEGDRVCAEVADTGSGIAPEHQTRIFEAFFTTKKLGNGTGLGLAISKKIVNDFGGRISFRTELGKGTCFRLEFPAMSGGQQRDAEVQAASDVPGVRGRVLVVDDEAQVRAILVRLLGRDHDVVAVASGQEALALLSADQRFDVVLLDVMMPHMCGTDVHEQIARRFPDLAARVVFMSGGTFTPGVTRYLGTVDNLRVDKPFDGPGLRQLVNRRVREARSDVQR